MLIFDIFFFQFPLETRQLVLPQSCALAATNRATNAKKNFMMILNVSESDFLNQMIKVCEGPDLLLYQVDKKYYLLHHDLSGMLEPWGPGSPSPSSTHTIFLHTSYPYLFKPGGQIMPTLSLLAPLPSPDFQAFIRPCLQKCL